MGNIISRKQAAGQIRKTLESFYMLSRSVPGEGATGENDTPELERFFILCGKLGENIRKKEYDTVLDSLDAESFRSFYHTVGILAESYNLHNAKYFKENEPAGITDLNIVLAENKKVDKKIEFINGFSQEELCSDKFTFASKMQAITDIIYSTFVSDDKENAVNKILNAFNLDDKVAFLNRIQSDATFLDRLMNKINGQEKDETLLLIGEMFIETGLFSDEAPVFIDNNKNDKIEAAYEKGNVYIEHSVPQHGGIRDYRTFPVKKYAARPFELIRFNYDERQIAVPALLLVKSWQGASAEPEGIFFNYKYENINWGKLNNKQKDEYFFEFVKHYLPAGFIEALGSPVQIIIMACITILSGGLLAELQTALAAAGVAMTAIYAKNAIGVIIQANNQKEAARTMQEAKRAAKVMAGCIAKLSLDVLDMICTVAGYVKGNRKIKRREDIDNFHLLTNENKEILFESLSNKELYEMVQNNPRYNWITKNYDLMTKEKIKDIVILRKDGSLNLDWPKYAGLQLETVKSIGNMKGKVYVSRSGSGSGNTLGYGDTIESWYASNSKRSIPSSFSEIQVGVMDVDRYKKVISIINLNIDDATKINLLKNEKISRRNAIDLISDYEAWNGKRFEVFKENGIVDGLKNINKSIDSIYGFSGKVAPWVVGNINMEGGASQLNTAFTWQLMLDSGIVTNNRTITIK